jgi:hypothetical protein
MSTRSVIFCLQIINLIAINQLSSAVASPSLLPRLAPSPSPQPYRPPTRETPLRTDSAGVRLSEEKGPSVVTQSTIATERPIAYQLAIGSLIECVQTLIPKLPAKFPISSSTVLKPKLLLIPNQSQPNQRPNK